MKAARSFLLDQLRRADVGDEKRGRRVGAGDAIGLLQRLGSQGGALAADAHRQAVLLGDLAQPLVDRCYIRMPTGERGDPQWMAQLRAEEVHREVNLVEVHLRERTMHEADIRPGGRLWRGDVVLQRDVDVLGLALLDLLGHIALLSPSQRRLTLHWLTRIVRTLHRRLHDGVRPPKGRSLFDSLPAEGYTARYLPKHRSAGQRKRA